MGDHGPRPGRAVPAGRVAHDSARARPVGRGTQLDAEASPCGCGQFGGKRGGRAHTARGGLVADDLHRLSAPTPQGSKRHVEAALGYESRGQVAAAVAPGVAARCGPDGAGAGRGGRPDGRGRDRGGGAVPVEGAAVARREQLLLVCRVVGIRGLRWRRVRHPPPQQVAARRRRHDTRHMHIAHWPCQSKTPAVLRKRPRGPTPS
mmetsp:Transcript_92965/g.265398  ORF Transcript_92965/g.265398 Transcript_92965/m.265398 type:complete len:205 (-) Transcript_92965:41-655(-)